MSRRTVSIAIPTFNRATYLREAVLSAFAQSRQPDEVVVSDNGSTDDTAEVLKELAASHTNLRVIRQPSNQGGIANWNLAVQGARGDVIGLCCDDDRLLPNHVENSVGHLEENPGTALVHAAFESLEVEPDGSYKTLRLPCERTRTVTGKHAVLYMIRHYCWPFHPSSLVFRRSTFERVGGFDPHYTLADTDWFLRVALRHRIDFISAFQVVNRRHPANWSNALGAVAMHDEVNKILLSYIGTLTDIGVSRSEVAGLRQLWLMNHRLRIARLAIARGRAGAQEPCVGAIRNLVENMPGGSMVPDALVRLGGGVFSRMLCVLQNFLPGGAAKYSSLGVTSPK